MHKSKPTKSKDKTLTKSGKSDASLAGLAEGGAHRAKIGHLLKEMAGWEQSK
jgi:hypothetical protein